MDVPSAEYFAEFQQKLGDAVSQALGYDNAVLGGLKSMGLYSVDLQLAAASAGYELLLPAEVAIVFLIYAEVLRFNNENSKVSLAFSSAKRETAAVHRSLLEFAFPLLKAFPEKTVFGDFVDLVAQDIKGAIERSRR